MEFSNEQQLAFNKYIERQNIFITGPGGSGKSALIKHIYADAINKNKNIQVCALTGCASILLNCKAKTLHSWAGIGLGNASTEKIVEKINKNKHAKKKWKEIEILIVDEVSMLSLKLFNMLNNIGKKIRRNSNPFGGIQIIFSGDFYQLPPVGNKDDQDTQKFCFESENWNSCFNTKIQLKKIFRQSDDTYINILTQIREGTIKRSSVNILSEYVNRKLSTNLLIEPTKLFPTKSSVDFINSNKMNQLTSNEKIYKYKFFSNPELSKTEKEERNKYSEKEIEHELNFIASNLIFDENLTLKIGAQVMCIINIQDDNNELIICNGSQGIITKFCEVTNYPYVKFNNGIEKLMVPHIWLSEKIPGIGISQIPLILAWALTIHKSQGASLDAAEIDIGSDIFECGQSYVALSRVKSLDGLYLTSFDVSKIKINKKVKEFYANF